MTSTEPGQFSELPHSDHPQAPYQSGFQHGVMDGNRSSNATSYIDQPKHGFAWHTSEFVKGYVNGYCSIPANKDVGTDDDRAILLSGWSRLCEIQNARLLFNTKMLKD